MTSGVCARLGGMISFVPVVTSGCDDVIITGDLKEASSNSRELGKYLAFASYMSQFSETLNKL